MTTLTFLRGPKRQRLSAALWLAISTLAGTVAFAEESEFAGFIRGKSQDRGAYQPPTLPPRQTQSSDAADEQSQQPLIVAPRPRIATTTGDAYEGDNETPDYALQDDADSRGPVARASYQPRQANPRQSQPPRLIRQTGHAHQPMTVHEHHGHEHPGHEHPGHEHPGHEHPGHEYSHGHEYDYAPGPFFEPACGIESSTCDGGCDTLCSGCDACRRRGFVGPLGLFRHTNQWFGAAEVMLMFRSGDTLPVLATGINDSVLFGGERYYDDMTAGGRFKVGTWLDPYHCNSLVMRGWGAGKESFGFNVDSSQSPSIARPFLNVSPTGPTPPNDTLLVASAADGLTGSLGIRGSSAVYGGDIAIHRQWQAGLGGVIEVLYGYQHMRMTEDLGITSTTFDAPNALVIDRSDYFEANNEFHGGEFGLATRYREGCWSFDGMIKIAAGSITRTATLVGNSAGIGDTGGLLVRSSNEGRFSNSTFGWIPELDATIGYRYTQNLDFTIGYHVIAMTDALQVSGMLDPQLAVNADFPNSQPARPRFGGNYGTFYVQSIHFGLQYVY